MSTLLKTKLAENSLEAGGAVLDLRAAAGRKRRCAKSGQGGYDLPLLLAVLCLIGFGMVMLYSASGYGAARSFGDEFFYVKKQALSFIPGLVFMLFTAKVNLKYVKKFSPLIYILSLILLALVFVPGLGVENYGARRWLNLGITTMQPSELSKFGLVIFLAAILTKYGANNVKGGVFALLATAAVCVLIMLEPNMSITISVLAVMLILLFVSGMRGKHFAVIAAVMVVGAAALILTAPYRIKRLTAFIDPWGNPLGEGYQLIQSLYALGGGGFFGVGLFNSRQKFLFLPFAESDFIFSIIGEELGFIGAAIVLLAYAFVVFRGVKIAVNAASRFECYLAAGITAVIAVQTLLNVAVVTGSVPPTGLPLPFMSAGGTSLMIFMGAAGILENVAHRAKSIA